MSKLKVEIKIIEQYRGRVSREHVFDLVAKFVNRKLNKNMLVKKS